MTPEQESNLLLNGSVLDVCRLMGLLLRRLRKDGGESQDAFARRAGVPLTTYKRLEKEGKGTLETFVQALSAQGRTAYLIYLFPQPLPPKLPSLQGKLAQLRSRNPERFTIPDAGETLAPSESEDDEA